MVNKDWKLGGYVIREDDKGISWLTYAYEKPCLGDKPFAPFVGLFAGWAKIELDTLIMSPWKVHQGSEDFHTWEEVERYLNSLPAWDKTKYFVKLADFGLSRLRDCKTMDDIPDHDAKPIALSLGFTWVEGGEDIEDEAIELPF